MSFRLFLFIEPSFMACGTPGADNAHRFSVVGVRDNENALAAVPTVKNRRSWLEWSGSGKVVESGSLSTVAASWKSALCFRRLAAAFFGSQVKTTPNSIR
jgi:hypothetical protein